jgi:UDP-2,3-diacylglucosamine pyrophosphatase LpxH
MVMQPYDVLILSDLHLGSKISNAEEALHLLKSLNFRRLILLGDIFCDLNFARLNKQHWNFLSYIRKLSNPKRNVDVVWIEGNHDYGLTNVMSHLVGIPVYRQYIWASAGKQNLAIHGHQFDTLIFKDNSIINRAVSGLHLSIQKMEPRGIPISHLLDTMGARWQRLTSRIAKRAAAYGQSLGAQRVFCGHTHESAMLRINDVEYYNAGAWTGAKSTFITVSGQEVEIREYTSRTDGRHSGEKRRDFAAATVGIA